MRPSPYTPPTMSGPLSGIRVVELGVWVAGPAGGGVLADWGADVVKIEPPAGDPARTFGGDARRRPPVQPAVRDGQPLEAQHRRRLRQATAGSTWSHELLAGADVFLTNIRLDALERLGLDPDDALRAGPALVYGIITGWGLEGPDRDRAAYDIGAFWARSGIASLLTEPGGEPPFQRGGMGDHGAGMTIAGGVVRRAALARAAPARGRSSPRRCCATGCTRSASTSTPRLRFGTPLAVATREAMANPIINCYQDARRDAGSG